MKKGVVTIGMFDGVHIGHQKVLKTAVDYSKKNKAESVVLTFDNLPTKQKGSINTLDEKVKLIKSIGIKRIQIIKFNNVKNLTPKEFFNLFLKKYNSIIIGYNFKFGKNREGHTEQIKRYCKNTIIVEPVKYRNIIVSSTNIKNLLLKGDIESANNLLNRKYSFNGKVVGGYGWGEKLGFPTANIKVEKSKILPEGIFISFTYLNKKRYNSVTYIGRRPTFNSRKISIETYILGLSKSIYNKKIKVELISKIRDDKKFKFPEYLVEEIKKDIKKAERYFRNKRNI